MLHAVGWALIDKKKNEAEQWTTDRELLASIFDVLQLLTYVTLRVNGAKSASKPKPFPRPDQVSQQKPDAVGMREFAQRFG